MKTIKSAFIGVLALLCYHLASGQCAFSEFPTDINMYDVHLCYMGASGNNAHTFKPSRQRVIHKQVDYHFPEGSVEALEINFDDGVGWQVIPAPGFVEEYYSIFYPTSGEKKVKVKYDYSGFDYELFTIEVKEENESYQSPDLIWEIETPEVFTPPANQYAPDSPYSNASSGKGNAYIKLAPGHQQITRPIIFVEGLDFEIVKKRDPNKNNQVIRYGANGWDVFSMGIGEARVPEDGEELFKHIPAQFQDFEEAGYDLVVLDFADGADYIQKNAAVFQQLIIEINNNKQADVNGLLHENIVVGASMGAIVSRYALAQMEAAGVPHCTGTYISFDGPQQGANIPLGIQALIWFNATFFAYDSNYADIIAGEALWRSLQRPAPRQLLNQNLLGTYQDGNLNLHCFIDDGSPNYRTFEQYENMAIDYNSLRHNLRTELDNLGYPKKTWNIALNNGNANGQNIGIETGGQLLDADAWFGEIGGMAFKARIWSLNGGSYADEDFGESWSSDQTIFYARRPLDFNLLGAPNVRVVAGLELVGNVASWDNAPGSIRDDIENNFVTLIKSVDVLENAVNYHFPIATFVPTVSALDLNTNDLFYDIESNLDKNNPNPDLCPFSKFYNPNTFEPHVKVNTTNRQWVNEQLNYTTFDLAVSEVLPNANGNTYNYGYARKTVPNLEVNNEGRLRVNDHGNTAYLNEALAERKSFDVFTKDCGDGNIDIKNGGAVVLGSDPEDLTSKTGQLHITNGNTLRVFSGGKLQIQRGSKLIVESGATLEIDAGANIDLWWSASTIHIKDGGELRINGEFNFSGSGYFQFDKGNILTFGPNANGFQLSGQGLDSRFIHLNKDATLDMEDHSLKLEMGKVTYDSGASIDNIGSELQLFVVTLQGSGSNILLKSNYLQSAQIQFSTIKEGQYGLQLEGTGLQSGGLFSLLYTDFSGLESSLWVRNVTNVSMNTCTFDGGLYGAEAILANSIQNFTCNNSHFFDYPLLNTAIWLTDVSLFRMGNSVIENVGTGIQALCQNGIPNKTNVMLTNGSIIQDCQRGIHIAKGGIDDSGEDYGLVAMKCSRLINNSVGISGIDILLDLDACMESDPACGNPKSNQFIQGEVGGDYFDIVYVDRSDIEEVYAQYNYWSPLPNPSNNAAGNYSLRKANSVYNCELASGPYENIALVIDGALPEAPTSCGANDPSPDPKVNKDAFSDTPYECGINTTDGLYLLDQQYRLATWNLNNEELSEARGQYQAIAALPNNVRAGADQMCRNYIDIARVMAYALSDATAGEYSSDWQDGTFIPAAGSERSLKVWPNPAGEVVRVWFNRGRYQVSVFDVLGREKFSDTVSDGAQIEVADWESGIYMLQVTDPVDGKAYSKKLMIK